MRSVARYAAICVVVFATSLVASALFVATLRATSNRARWTARSVAITGVSRRVLARLAR